MLSYRHAFHAGNHADVIKHLTLVLCCEHLCKKDKAFSYLDTHAGAGMYDLNSEAARKNSEYLNGINMLANMASVPKVFSSYLSLIEQAKKKNRFAYPGSPWFAAQVLRPFDQLNLFELHTSDYAKLRQLFSSDKRARIHNLDGYQSVKSLFPPASRRGITLIDPPYELEHEYQSVLNTLKEGIKRFNTGIYLVWYPLINRDGSAKSKAWEKMLKHIQSDFSQEQLHIQFSPDTEAKGMYGSGLAIINPPWGLAEQLQDALSFLCKSTDSKTSQFKIEARAVNQHSQSR